MLQTGDISLTSLDSSRSGTTSLSAVHPDGLIKSSSDSLVTTEPRSINKSTDHLNRLFSATSKAKKSIYVKLGVDRTIHVVHFAQREECQYDGDTSMHPGHEYYNNTILLFFIHGVGGSTGMWEPQINYFLSHGYEVLSVDLLGHGASSSPRDYKAYKFEALAEDVLFLFDKFHKQRNVLVGHSYGSSFCTLLSKVRSNRVCKTVLISGGGPTTLAPDSCSAFCLPLPIFMCIQSSLVKVFRRMAFHENTGRNIRHRIATFQISSYALKAVMQGQYWPESDEDYHAGVTVPVLLIYGRGDQFVTLDEELWMKETIYGAQLEIVDNAGHMVTLETPKKVNELIHHFLNRDPSTRSHSSKLAADIEHAQDEHVREQQVGGYARLDDTHTSNAMTGCSRASACSTIGLSRASLRSTHKTMF